MIGNGDARARARGCARSRAARRPGRRRARRRRTGSSRRIGSPVRRHRARRVTPRAQRAVEDHQHRRGRAPDVALAIGNRPVVAAHVAQHAEMPLLVVRDRAGTRAAPRRRRPLRRGSGVELERRLDPAHDRRHAIAGDRLVVRRARPSTATRVARQADFLRGLAQRGGGDVAIVGLDAAAGKADLARDGRAGRRCAACSSSVQAVGAVDQRHQHRRRRRRAFAAGQAKAVAHAERARRARAARGAARASGCCSVGGKVRTAAVASRRHGARTRGATERAAILPPRRASALSRASSNVPAQRGRQVRDVAGARASSCAVAARAATRR